MLHCYSVAIFSRFLVFSWCILLLSWTISAIETLETLCRSWVSEPMRRFFGATHGRWFFMIFFIYAFSCETVCGDKVVNFDTGVLCCVHNFTVYKPLLKHEKLAWLFHLADSSLTVVIRWSRARAWIKTQSRQGSVKNSFIYKEKSVL